MANRSLSRSCPSWVFVSACVWLLNVLPTHGESTLADDIEKEESGEATRVQLELLQSSRMQSRTQRQEATKFYDEADRDPELKNYEGYIEDKFAELARTSDIPPSYLSCVQGVVSELESASNVTELACENANHVCGSVFDDVSQVSFYMKVALHPAVETVCETGFFRGLSAALWLCAKPNMQLYSFDLDFPVPYLETLKARFGSRFGHFQGDSTQTVPQALASTSACCDVSIVDGGHTGDVPLTDIRSFLHAAAKPACASKPSLLVIDEVMYRIGEDGPGGLSVIVDDELFSTTEAWATAVNSNLITNSVCCGFSRGHFCTGYPANSTSEPLTKAFRTCD